MTPSERLASQRAAQLAADEAAARELARRYGVAWARVKADLERLTGQIAAARLAGETVDEAWLIRHGVLERLERRVLTETQVYVDFAEGRITADQARAFAAGHADAFALVNATTPTAFLPLQAIVARTTVGAPLRSLLERIAPDAAQAAADMLVEAVVAGTGPRETARALRDTLQAPLWRTLRIARTETIGAYRDGAIDTYKANRDVLEGWVWIAQLSTRTCAACWALHGTVHPVDEMFASHPNCRCSPAPRTRSWADLGFPGVPETRLDVTPGAERFAALPSSSKLRILGPGKLAAYEDGSIALDDLVQNTLSPVWGPGIRERSLRDALLTS